MIAIENLVKRFGKVVALDQVELNIHSGELFFLLGPSGCGKTTLLRHIAGFCRPDAGRILFDGEDITPVPPHQRNTAMVFQNYALWPHLTVARNVAFGLEERRVPSREIAASVLEALRAVHLEEVSQRRINELSGGQQQRVALARALVIRPKCLLLDEPLSNLDPRLRLEMRGEIRRICREQRLTAVYVTHDQQEALSIADRIAVLSAGRILQVGTPAEIYRKPRNRFVAEFIGEVNMLKARITGRTDFLELDVEGTQIRLPRPANSNDEKIGSHLAIGLRPEAIRIADQKSQGLAWIAKLTETVYLGATAQHRFEFGESILKVSEPNPQPAQYRIGNDYPLSVRPEDVILLPEPEQG